MTAVLEQLCARLDYRFLDGDLLALALSHRSVQGNNNERLEFLGDAILGCVIAQDLYQRFPNATEGQLSCLRASLVNKEILAELARELTINDALLLGAGEMKSGGRQRSSILADALEALIGAIYLDADFAVAQRCILHWYRKKLGLINATELDRDPKTQLQEYLQRQHLPLPQYEIILVEGADHLQKFHVRCVVASLQQTTQGVGNSRRKAEQHAAQLMLEKIYEH